jgi:ribosomal protein S18 acetylase RimI-like enzyme
MSNVSRQQMPTIEEILALDLLTLREHTERAGDQLDPELQAARIQESLKISRLCAVRRHDELVAYAMLNQASGAFWFVRAFSIHPAHRTAPVVRELLGEFALVVQREGIAELRSHVYKTNRLSMAFHRKLGFRVAKENEKGVEFFATVAELAANPSIERTRSGLRPPRAAHVER